MAPGPGPHAPGKVVNGPDLSFDSQTPALTYLDEVGHGTHMAGIIAGRDQATPSGWQTYAGDTNDFIGVAPDAHIVNVKVADEQGAVDVSQVLAGIDWVVQHRNDNGLNIRVINLSFGTNSTQSYMLDPLAYAAEVAWHSGHRGGGHRGQQRGGQQRAQRPGVRPLPHRRRRGRHAGQPQPGRRTPSPRSPATATGTRNPDLVAPGVHIASLRDPGSNIDLQYGATATVGGRFFLGSGTSQAAAVVSGAAALLLGQHPDWHPRPGQVRADLVGHAARQPVRQRAGQPASSTWRRALSAVALEARRLHAVRTLPATGLGSLDAARGGVDVTSNGVALTGEQDIMGNSFNSAAMAPPRPRRRPGTAAP